MKIVTVAGTRATSGEPPRSTAYYYADLERLKRKNGPEPEEPRQNPDELSEYVESNEVINDGAVKEVPPLRDRQWSLPEYSTPENGRKLPEETYSTAGTFPMPEPKEKEPLLAELEVVGRLPLTQLETTPGVRRSRSWYLCCPNVADEEISRESSWRYSSLRPVTAPPLPGQNGIHMVTTSSGRAEDLSTLRAERDALARALAAERQRAATAARAHDARLAELHGVIAELVRRRAADKQATAIPEEEVSDECESTTQPAGELDNDADLSRTEQNDTSSALSPAELPAAEHEPEHEHERARERDDTTDTSTQEIHVRVEKPVSELPSSANTDHCETSFNMSERDSEICVSTARCCQHARGHAAGVPGMLPPSPGRCESRQAKIASRVRLRRTEESQSSQIITDESWWSEAAERLARGLCAQADLREALVAAAGDDVEDSLEPAGSASVSLWRARCVRLAADCRVLDVALARAVDTAHRLSSACAMQESSCVAVCGALRAADRALEAYDVLLALAETAARPRDDPERCAAEAVAIRLLRRLSRAPVWGEPLLSPGPWHDHHTSPSGEEESWSPALESQLRRHAARLKRETVALRHARPPPRLYSPHDMDDEEETSCVDSNAADMEAAVLVQEVLAAREARLASRLAANTHSHKSESGRRERHWLHSQPETDL